MKGMKTDNIIFSSLRVVFLTQISHRLHLNLRRLTHPHRRRTNRRFLRRRRIRLPQVAHFLLCQTYQEFTAF